MCDYAGIDTPADLRGRSLRPLAAGESPADWRDHLVVETYGPIEGRMVRTDRYKYIVYERGRNREQLFDMAEDRGELVDLSVNADYDDALDEHRELLLEWCIETDDAFGGFNDYPGVPRIPGYEYLELRERFGNRE
jgi:arylsulfatase A-like enzyme